MNELVHVNVGIAGCKLMTSAGIFFLLFLIHKPCNKELKNLNRSVVMEKSQTSAYRIDLALGSSSGNTAKPQFDINIP